MTDMAGTPINLNVPETREALSNVSYDTGGGVGPSGGSVATDFAKILDGYRAKADFNNANAQAAVSDNPKNAMMFRQLSDLYNYAVETQLLVRTANQATTGFRQLVTGQ